jgi:hypothetical protein
MHLIFAPPKGLKISLTSCSSPGRPPMAADLGSNPHSRDGSALAQALPKYPAASVRNYCSGAYRRLVDGQHFSRGALYLIPQNRTYRGEILHHGTAYPASPEVWQIVHDKLAANRGGTAAFSRSRNHPGMFVPG